MDEPKYPEYGGGKTCYRVRFTFNGRVLQPWCAAHEVDLENLSEALKESGQATEN